MSSPLCLPVEEQQNGERIDKFLQESIPEPGAEMDYAGFCENRRETGR